MMSGRLWCLLMALALLGLAGSARVGAAATITVSTTADDLTVNGNCTLREAIQAANTDTAVDACPAGNGGDTIAVGAHTYTLSIAGKNEDDNATGDLDIKAPLTINGAGPGLGASSTILDANSIDRAFDVSPVAVTLSSMTVEHGATAADGGAIRNAGTLTVMNGELYGNGL